MKLFHNILLVTRSAVLLYFHVDIWWGFPQLWLWPYLGQVSRVCNQLLFGHKWHISMGVVLIASWSRKKTVFVPGVFVFHDHVQFCLTPWSLHLFICLLLMGQYPISHNCWWSHLRQGGQSAKLSNYGESSCVWYNDITHDCFGGLRHLDVEKKDCCSVVIFILVMMFYIKPWWTPWILRCTPWCIYQCCRYDLRVFASLFLMGLWCWFHSCTMCGWV